jgi:hypothetical protein
LGGIYQAENSIAYSEIIIAPKPVGEIKWVKCSFNSPKGLISSNWKINENSFVLEIEIPKNANANIILPDEFKNSVVNIIDKQNEKPIDIKIENGVFKISSGEFEIIASR